MTKYDKYIKNYHIQIGKSLKNEEHKSEIGKLIGNLR